MTIISLEMAGTIKIKTLYLFKFLMLKEDSIWYIVR